MSEKYQMHLSLSGTVFKYPLLFSVYPEHNSRKLTRREFAWLSILNGWPDVLQKELKNNKTIILDQGPVYLLTEISEFGPEYLRRQKAEKFMAGFVFSMG